MPFFVSTMSHSAAVSPLSDGRSLQNVRNSVLHGAKGQRHESFVRGDTCPVWKLRLEFLGHVSADASHSPIGE